MKAFRIRIADDPQIRAPSNRTSFLRVFPCGPYAVALLAS